MPFIKTIDTSNPVIHGLAGIKYEPWGLDAKISTKVDKFKGEAEHWETAIYNIQNLKHLYQHETSSIKFKWWNG